MHAEGRQCLDQEQDKGAARPRTCEMDAGNKKARARRAFKKVISGFPRTAVVGPGREEGPGRTRSASKVAGFQSAPCRSPAFLDGSLPGKSGCGEAVASETRAKRRTASARAAAAQRRLRHAARARRNRL